MARASKDLARRLRFDRFPRPDVFRRHYVLAGLGATAVALGLWVALTGILRQRQYLPGPLSQNHATFGDRCEKCHTPFQSVANTACLECHPGRTHSQFEVATPQCRDCHIEHRAGGVLLAVSAQSCTRCHAQLQTKRPSPSVIQASIRTFATHPQFVPLRDGQRDVAAIRFNHKVHLTSDKIARETVGPTGKLECRDCHQPDARGMYMQPIVFEPHCKRCHEQKPPTPIGSIEAAHKSPETVRADLTAQVSVIGITNADAIFKGRESTLPGIPNRPPLSQAQSLQKYLPEEIDRIESALYQPFDGTAPLLEHNKYCFLCHLPEGERARGELPKIQETKLPHRWLQRAQFSHRKHDLVACTTCHETIEKSERTSDVNLPHKELCLRCHLDSRQQSAGANCSQCHLYHETSKQPELRRATLKELSLDALTGR